MARLIKKKILAYLLTVLKEDMLSQPFNGQISSVVDCCDFMLNFLEGENDHP